MGNERRLAPKRIGIGAKAGIAVAAALGIAYGAGCAWWSGHLMPDTVVSGVNVGGMEDRAAADLVSSKRDSWEFSVSGQGVDARLGADDVGLTIDGEAGVRQAREAQPAWQWPQLIISKANAAQGESGMEMSRDKIAEAAQRVVSEANKGRKAPVDARIAKDESGDWRIVPEVDGDLLDANAAAESIERAINDGDTQIELGDDVVVQPKVRSDDKHLNETMERIRNVLSADIVIKMNGKEMAELKGDALKSAVSVDKDGNQTIDRSAVAKWVAANSDPKCDTVGTERHYKRADGKEVTVSGGTYGWLSDSGKLTGFVYDAVTKFGDGTNKAGDVVNVDVPVKQKADKWNPGGREWGAYLDIDTSEQHARYYSAKDELLWESDVVTGDPTNGNATPSGAWMFNNKDTNVTLTGPMVNGKPKWESLVRFWLPFVDNSVGAHDSSWRSSYGGTIYMGAGSHGCTNVPPENMPALYELASPGTAVIVHS